MLDSKGAKITVFTVYTQRESLLLNAFLCIVIRVGAVETLSCTTETNRYLLSTICFQSVKVNY